MTDVTTAFPPLAPAPHDRGAEDGRAAGWLSPSPGEVAAHAAEAIVAVDAQGRVVFWNAAAERLLGYPAGEVLGGAFTALLPDEARDAFLAAAERAASGDPPFPPAPARLRARARSGELRDVALSLACSRDAGPPLLTAVMRAAEPADGGAGASGLEAVRASEERYRALVELSPEAIVVHRDGVIVFINQTGTALVGVDRASDPVGQPLLRYVHPAYHAAVAARIGTLAEAGARTDSAEYRLVRGDGTTVEVEAVSVALRYAGAPAVQTVVRDITVRRAQERAMRESEGRLRSAEHHARQMADRMRAVAGAASLVVAASSLETLQAMLRQACGMVIPFDVFTFGMYDDRAHALDFLRDPWLNLPRMSVPLAGRPSDLVVRERRSLLTHRATDPRAAGAVLVGDDRRSESVIRCPIYTAEGVLGVLSVQSYTPDVYGEGDVEVLETIAALAATAIRNQRLVEEIRRSEERLAYQAFHDSLTDLANRTLFLERVGSALERAAGHPDTVAVLFLDLDNFKTVNDSLGHSEGDRLLVAAAERLLNATRGCDTVARLGGDEFAVLLANVRNEGDIVSVATRITAALRAPFALQGTEAFVSASIGIARAGAGASAEELLRNADAAMYSAKTRGKGQYVVFEAAMHAAVLARLGLEADLRRAIAGDEFRLHYQPIVDLRTRALVGVEALVRWEHPDRGTVAPTEFVSFAEETGLIVPIGQWVLVEACRQGAAWRRDPAFGGSLQITVNLSGRQLHEASLVGDVRRALAASGLAPEALVLEVTESVMMEHTELTLARLHELRSLGVSLAVDDFGTGYSSLSYLQSFPIDTLKVDKTFVDAVGRDGVDPVLARAIVALGGALQLKTVAEGIERESQAAELARLGCVLGQGYLWAPPLDPAALTARLDGGRLTAGDAAG
jgi:diguanylate cyclase (GGDEF)-like protein/PAS domain S-box-containing protein